MSFYNEREVKSCRKASRCYWCAESIEVGSPKFNITGVYQGDFGSSDFHPECKAALDQYQKLYGRANDYGWPEEGSCKRGGIEER